ncbi:MAG: DsbA family protein [Actinomycetota bacterium]|nr:DsbA family protein [Actinomycetota bacterium]
MSAGHEIDLDVFVDPACPFCWVTTRWVENVRRQRDYSVRWRWISLKMINEGTEYKDPRHAMGHRAGLAGLRILDAVRAKHGNDAVGEAYTAFGTGIHVDGRQEEFGGDPAAFFTERLVSAGYSEDEAAKLAAHADDDSHDVTIRAESDLAFERTGPGVGTPILTFQPDGDDPRSFFGPVISRAPRGEEALKLWDAVETLAASGMAELKRSLRDPLDLT